MFAATILAGSWTLYAQAEEEEAERVREAAKAFDEIMSVPEKAIPTG